MRIFQVTFEGSEKEREYYDANFASIDVSCKSCGVVEAANKALALLQVDYRTYDLRATDVKLLAESDD